MKKLIVLALIFLTTFSAALAERLDKDPPAAPVIDSATVNFSAMPYQITVFGKNLVGLNEGMFKINVAGIPIEYFSNRSDAQLDFELPTAIATEGTYRMTLENVGGQVVYELAIGAIGPPGEKGDPGPVGATGPTGAAGLAGVPGNNSLIALTSENAGVNCTNGGVVLKVGVDINKNSQLDVSEVSQANYVCNGADSGSQPSGPIRVAASPSIQAVNAFVNVTVTTDQSPSYGYQFYATGSCKFYDTANNTLSNYITTSSYGGFASAAMTNTDLSGGPCIAYAGYDDYSTNTHLIGSALATFLPELPGTTDPPPASITVTANPSTQSVNSNVLVTAVFSEPPSYGVNFYTGGSCRLYNAAANSWDNYLSTSTTAGIASVAMTNTSGGPCIVYVGSYNGYEEIVGTALATFIP